MSNNLHANWSANSVMDDEHEKSRMKDVKNKLASLISSLNLGSEEMLVEEYVLAGEEIVDAKYTMPELVDLVWGSLKSMWG